MYIRVFVGLWDLTIVHNCIFFLILFYGYIYIYICITLHVYYLIQINKNKKIIYIRIPPYLAFGCVILEADCFHNDLLL